jgi:hypothetical protein
MTTIHPGGTRARAKRDSGVFRRVGVVLAAFLLAAVLALCTSGPTTTTPSSTTPASTATVSPTDAADFLAHARDIYTSGGITRDGQPLEPNLNGITESEFLGLTVQNGTTLTLDGTAYRFVAVNPWAATRWALPAEVPAGTQRARYAMADITDTGGVPVTVRVLDGSRVTEEFLYHYIGIHVENFSVAAEMQRAGDFRFIFLYDYPATGAAEEALWLALWPAS